MMQDADELLSRYDDLADDVTRANYQFFTAALERWLDFMDGSPDVAPILQRVESTLDFERWRQDSLRPSPGIGPGVIDLPKNEDGRLAALVGLFRSLTDDNKVFQFAHSYVSSSSGLDDNVADLVEQLFAPLARDLRRHIVLNLRHPTMAPAADRVVPLNHNTLEYEALIKAVDGLAEALRQSNDYEDAEEKEQRAAEIAAGRQLLGARRVRARALFETLGRVIADFIRRFYDTALGRAAHKLLNLIQDWLPSFTSFGDS